jgi:UDP-3-O-[3-hydroxymyristoyl] glucosamine N-acyltransferase
MHPPKDELSLRDVAALVDGRVVGDADVVVERIAPLAQAGARSLGLLAAARYVRLLPDCQAAGLLVSEALADRSPEDVPNRVVVADAHRALARLLEHLHAPSVPDPAIHPTAVLGRGVQLGTNVAVGPYTVVEEGVELGDDVIIGAHCCIGEGVRIGRGSRLYPQVVVYPGAEIGSRVILHAGVRIGVDGFGYVVEDGEIRKVPQVGRCVIEDDVEIGANTCLDRGSIGDTIVGRSAKLDNLIQLGHNVTVGPSSMLAAQTGVAGSSHVGAGVVAGGQVGIAGHLEIGDGARLAAQAGIIGDVPAGATVSGYPARGHREYLKAMSHVFRLPDLVRRLERLEDTVRQDADDGPTKGPSAAG